MNPFFIVTAILGFLTVFLVMIKPIKYVFGIGINAIFGAVGIFVTNIFMAQFGINLGINILTLGIVGILGLPGFCAMILISALL